MKRVFALVCTISMLLSLAACGGQGKTSDASVNASSPSGSSVSSDANTPTMDYPTKPITIACGWAAGGSADLMSRAIAADAKEYLGVSATVVNREGAGATICFAEAADSANDGYQLVFVNSGVFSAQPLLREVEYSINDFDFICGIAFAPLALVVPASMGVSTLDEWVEYMNDNHVEAVVATSGAAGSIPAYGAEALLPELGLEAYNILNTSGSGEVITALLGGEVNCGYFHPHEAKAYVESGDFVILGVSTEERMPTFPETPTFKEQGIDHINNLSQGIGAPAGLPPEIRSYLEEKILKIVKEGKNFQTYAQNSGVQVQLMTGEEFYQLVEEQTETYKTLFG